MFFAPKSDKTKRFYNRLVRENSDKSIWGKQKRFDAGKFAYSSSIKKYFTQVVSEVVESTDRVLDAGCGAGIFMPHISPLCKSLTGIDISKEFVRNSQNVISRFGLKNTDVVQGNVIDMPFTDDFFDVTFMLDLLHHVTFTAETIAEAQRVTKPGGHIIIYEPNKLNPLLWLLCLLDRNEWGALRLGSKKTYRKLLQERFSIKRMEYSGLLLGPDSQFNCFITNVLDQPIISHGLGWLQPKIFILLSNLKSS